MDPAEERGTGNRALGESVQQPDREGLSGDGAYRLCDTLARRVGTFRRALRGDLPTRVEPMRVQVEPQAKAVKTKPRSYDPVKKRWRATCIAALIALVCWL